MVLASALPSSRVASVRSRTETSSSAQIWLNAAWSNLPAFFSHASAWALAASGAVVFKVPNVYSALGSAADAGTTSPRHAPAASPAASSHLRAVTVWSLQYGLGSGRNDAQAAQNSTLRED